MSGNTITLAQLEGTDLGEHRASYRDTDTLLYALAVGAPADDLELAYERDQRVLPTYGCAIGLWAVEAAGQLGAYDPHRSLHASQSLIVKESLPTSGTVLMSGRIAHVWDKGKAAMVDIDVDCDYFTATYSIFLPGMGGWGGERGPKTQLGHTPELNRTSEFHTSPNQAALYRLTGDRHPVHIDPEIAKANGFERPILHGLCTLGITTRVLAEQAGSHPAALTSLSVRLSAPVLPGERLVINSGTDGTKQYFATHVGDTAVLGSGQATFSR